MLRLKELRNERGLSQEQLGDILGRSQTSIYSYEKGNYEPDVDMLITAARYFNVSVDYLVGNTDIRTPLEPQDIQLAHRINRLDQPEVVRAIMTILDWGESK